jgi:hypothetical protein
VRSRSVSGIVSPSHRCLLYRLPDRVMREMHRSRPHPPGQAGRRDPHRGQLRTRRRPRRVPHRSQMLPGRLPQERGRRRPAGPAHRARDLEGQDSAALQSTREAVPLARERPSYRPTIGGLPGHRRVADLWSGRSWLRLGGSGAFRSELGTDCADEEVTVVGAWSVPPATRELRGWVRGWVRHRAELVRLRATLKCQIHAVLAGAGVTVLMSDRFGWAAAARSVLMFAARRLLPIPGLSDYRATPSGAVGRADPGRVTQRPRLQPHTPPRVPERFFALNPRAGDGAGRHRVRRETEDNGNHPASLRRPTRADRTAVQERCWRARGDPVGHFGQLTCGERIAGCGSCDMGAGRDGCLPRSLGRSSLGAQLGTTATPSRSGQIRVHPGNIKNRRRR